MWVDLEAGVAGLEGCRQRCWEEHTKQREQHEHLLDVLTKKKNIKKENNMNLYQRSKYFSYIKKENI